MKEKNDEFRFLYILAFVTLISILSIEFAILYFIFDKNVINKYLIGLLVEIAGFLILGLYSMSKKIKTIVANPYRGNVIRLSILYLMIMDIVNLISLPVIPIKLFIGIQGVILIIYILIVIGFTVIGIMNK